MTTKQFYIIAGAIDIITATIVSTFYFIHRCELIADNVIRRISVNGEVLSRPFTYGGSAVNASIIFLFILFFMILFSWLVHELTETQLD